RQAIATNGAVRWTGLVQPSWKVPVGAGTFKGLMDVDGPQVYRVYGYRGDPAAPALGSELAAISGVTMVASTPSVVTVRATRAEVPAIVALPAVQWVEIKPLVVPLNANARWVTDTGVRDLYAATAPGRLTGAGQTAGVADTAVNYDDDGG